LSSPLVGISYKGCHYFAFGKNTLSQKNAEKGNEIVSFESLELEEGAENETPPSQLNEMLSYLKEKLEPTDYADLMTKLGLEQDISNAELLAAFKKLLKGEEEEEEEEEEPEEKEKKAMDYKEFIKKCMEGGKSLKECSAEFKEKYPEPSKEEIAEVEELAKEFGKKEGEEGPEDELAALKLRIAALEEKDKLAGISSKVEELVKDKHLAPVQREGALKLAARLDPEGQEELLEFFRTTQKLTVHTDVGKLESVIPGEEGSDITAERRAELIELHGLQGLIDDKADKSKLPWRNN
jgi:ferredoxin